MIDQYLSLPTGATKPVEDVNAIVNSPGTRLGAPSLAIGDKSSTGVRLATADGAKEDFTFNTNKGGHLGYLHVGTLDSDERGLGVSEISIDSENLISDGSATSYLPASIFGKRSVVSPFFGHRFNSSTVVQTSVYNRTGAAADIGASMTVARTSKMLRIAKRLGLPASALLNSPTGKSIVRPQVSKGNKECGCVHPPSSGAGFRDVIGYATDLTNVAVTSAGTLTFSTTKPGLLGRLVIQPATNDQFGLRVTSLLINGRTFLPGDADASMFNAENVNNPLIGTYVDSTVEVKIGLYNPQATVGGIDVIAGFTAF